ncbi:glutamine amidotransferase [Candidatus Dojkabacteria bacterium]|uniref:Lipid II isoglutaminyl synthase (glutamine-hydrolyzing) subunit GatD n=1 Tax=Candidatus Dojkabacteria bacterium TaxID=2099670 RepID=A0A955IDL5_9BACT|nr:glutamine amidotransferase [Candidatus Dojkabacteria bacterium]
MYNDKHKLKFVHLYPEEMNIYGDMGNVLTLKKRCEWRGIEFEITNINLNSNKFEQGDIYFMGGGQDNDMYKVFEDLQKYKNTFLNDEIANNKQFLLICGGFQLFGKYFIDFQGRQISGLGILPLETKAPSDNLHDRCLGNLVTEINPNLIEEVNKYYGKKSSNYLVGFENHGGQTYFTDDSVSPLGKVIIGSGNNSKEMIEGVFYKNIIGSYMHGSLLPKNPHLADFIIGRALFRKYGESFQLTTLNDSVEWNSHKAILNKMGVTYNF